MNQQQTVSVTVFPKNTMFLNGKWMPADELVSLSYIAANMALDNAIPRSKDRLYGAMNASWTTDEQLVLKCFCRCVGQEFAR